MVKKNTIILCADDYGLNDAISQGICQLAAKERLSAVSAMMTVADLESQAKALLAANPKIAIGLHCNLTEGMFLSQPHRPLYSLKNLLAGSLLRCIDVPLILKELNAQLDRFCEVFNRLPDFIDGHQHVHQFPQIREALLLIYQQRLAQETLPIRCSYPVISSKTRALKSLILNWTGGKGLKKELQRLAIPHNPYFSGIYNFDKKTNYRKLFQQWLAVAPSNTLIMCHPALPNSSNDPIAHNRFIEFNYFNSEEFIQDCSANNIELA